MGLSVLFFVHSFNQSFLGDCSSTSPAVSPIGEHFMFLIKNGLAFSPVLFLQWALVDDLKETSHGSNAFLLSIQKQKYRRLFIFCNNCFN